MNISRLGLTTQLVLMSCMFVAFLLGVNGFAIWTLHHNNAMAERTMKRYGERVMPALRMTALAEANTARIRAVAMSSEPELAAMFGNEITEAINDFGTALGEILALPLDHDERELLALIKRHSDIAIGAIGAVHKLKAEGKLSEARGELHDRFEPATREFFKAVGSFSDLQQRTANAARQEMSDMAQRSMKLELMIGVFLLVGASAISIALVKHVRRLLREFSDCAVRVADGDLTGNTISAQAGELGILSAAMTRMNNNLHNIVGLVRNGTDRIADASSEIAAGNLDLSVRTEEQARSLEGTAASIGKLTGRVKENAEHARHASGLATSASTVAVQGREVVAQVMATMESIRSSSRRVGEIISVIDGIAFQTNILALNAAVEAARAGEQGRGFAVVAAEVRNLAQRSAGAAKEIKTLIAASVAQVEVGRKLTAQAGDTMSALVHSVDSVTEIMGAINVASQQQSEGIEQVNYAIVNMDQVTQQNAALVEQAAAAAASLQQQAVVLAEMVSIFKLGEEPRTALPGARNVFRSQVWIEG
ncbi:MAG: methyl-accepting chemotaxis protein [Telluria sp.]|nr:methyl-accepting chemotaxis protein [Telluria sp.]